MDTMETTKIVGGVCGALLVFLLLGWVGETLYHVGASGHGDGEHVSGYPIEVTETADVGAKEEVPFEELLAAADPARGAKLFSKCKACHSVENGKNGTGPHLAAIVGRQVATVSEFSYSDNMVAHGGNWDPNSLDAFLTKPSAYIPGTKMSFPGLKKPEDRASVVKYLETLQ